MEHTKPIGRDPIIAEKERDKRIFFFFISSKKQFSAMNSRKHSIYCFFHNVSEFLAF